MYFGAAVDILPNRLPETQREISLNHGWRFHLGECGMAFAPLFDDADWTPVELPHDFSIARPFSAQLEAESGFLPGGVGWYRRGMTLPPGWAQKRLTISFDGAYQDTRVYWNGHRLGANRYGYNCFSFDLIPYGICDGRTENVLAVRVENAIPSSRWYSGSGLFRDVSLLVQNPVHIPQNGIRVTTPEDGVGRACVSAMVENDTGHSCGITLCHRIYRDTGESVAVHTGELILPEGRMVFKISMTVPEPRLWSPEEPNLYYLETTLLEGGQVWDREVTEFGFRWFSFDRTGFHLNGRNVKLRGVCLHSNHGALGGAAHEDAMARQLEILKDMGVNAIRTSHNPPAQPFVGLCARMGFLVLEDIFDGWNVSKNGNINDFGRCFRTPVSPEDCPRGMRPGLIWGENVLRAAVRRDRNAPCVIAWALGNELQEGGYADELFPEIARRLVRACWDEDGTRPAVICDNTKGTHPVLTQVADMIAESGGVVGCNYASGEQLDALSRRYPALLCSETASAIHSRGVYRSRTGAADVDGKLHLTAYDTSTVGWGMTAWESFFTTVTRDFVSGEFVWTGFDYIGEPTPWNGISPGSITGCGPIPNSSYFGIVDTAGFPKDTYYFYRSQWNRNRLTLHLVTAWDGENLALDGGKTPVWIYSNAPQILLLRNGVPMGTALRRMHTTTAGHCYHTYETKALNSACTLDKDSPNLAAVFWVSYQPGELSAVALDEAGHPLTPDGGTASVKTPDLASQIHIHLNKDILDKEGALAYLEVTITDSRGAVCTTYAEQLHLSLTGPGRILGVDNGDQATTGKFQQPEALLSAAQAQICAWAGKALAIIAPTGEAGIIEMQVTGPGLQPARAAVTAAFRGEEPLHCRLIRDCILRPGEQPALPETASLTLRSGKALPIPVRWAAIEARETPGDFAVPGVVDTPHWGFLPVTGRVHFIPSLAALENVSVAGAPGLCPTLPDTVRGILPDGTLWGAFPVRWEMPPLLEAGNLRACGEACVFGPETMAVVAFLRIAAAQGAVRRDVAPAASRVTADGAGKRLTYRWDTAQIVRMISMEAEHPTAVSLAYSLNGHDFLPLRPEIRRESGRWVFSLSEPVNPVALEIVWTEAEPCQVEIFTVTDSLRAGATAELEAVYLDGKPLPGFRPDCLEYHLSCLPQAVRAIGCDNAAVTVLPSADRRIYIRTRSEDGLSRALYTLFV